MINSAIRGLSGHASLRLALVAVSVLWLAIGVILLLSIAGTAWAADAHRSLLAARSLRDGTFGTVEGYLYSPLAAALTIPALVLPEGVAVAGWLLLKVIVLLVGTLVVTRGLERVDRLLAVAAAIAFLLENYIHDSRAWFKLIPGNWEAGQVEAGLKAWARRYDELKQRGINPHNHLEPSNPFSPEEVAWIEEYRRTGKIPAMKTHGREPFELGGGYLRFRRIYAGGDRLLLTRNERTSREEALVA